MKYTLHASFVLFPLLLGSFSVGVPVYGFSVPSAMAAEAQQGREAFIRSLKQSIMDALQSKSLTVEQKQATLQKAFVQYVDTDWIGQFVLGQAWNKASAEQKSQYLSLYRTYLTNNYVSHFDDEANDKLQDIKILSIKDAEDSHFQVVTEMVLEGRSPVKVNYLARDDGGAYKVVDIIIEGVSLLNTHRSEFSQLTASGGIDGVIAKFKEKASKSKN